MLRVYKSASGDTGQLIHEVAHIMCSSRKSCLDAKPQIPDRYERPDEIAAFANVNWFFGLDYVWRLSAHLTGRFGDDSTVRSVEVSNIDSDVAILSQLDT